jgi:hypothetical protein
MIVDWIIRENGSVPFSVATWSTEIILQDSNHFDMAIFHFGIEMLEICYKRKS